MTRYVACGIDYYWLDILIRQIENKPRRALDMYLYSLQMCAFVLKYVLLYANENYKNMYFAKLPYYIVL